MYSYETITTFLTDIPVPVKEIADLRLVYHTLTRTLLEKGLADCRIFEYGMACGGRKYEFRFRLSQKDTAKFPPGPISKTLIVLAKDGTRIELRNEDMICETSAKPELFGVEEEPGASETPEMLEEPEEAVQAGDLEPDGGETV